MNILMVWLEKPSAMCFESAEKAISLGKSLLLSLVLQHLLCLDLQQPQKTIRVPEVLTAKLAIYSLG